MNRRKFIQLAGSAGIAATPLLQQLANATPSATTPRTLVLVELKGGNDSLNTVIPYADPLYYKARPNIHIKRDKALQLDESIALHPALKPLLPAWEGQDLSIIQGTGYPEPNRSHFRSIEIWETASDSGEYLQEGWLAPIINGLEHQSAEQQEHAIKAVAFAEDQGPMTGAVNNSLVFASLDQFLRQAKGVSSTRSTTANAALNHIFDVRQTTVTAARDFANSLQQSRPLQVRFPNTAFATQMESIAQLIVNQAGPRIYKAGIGSFDTHARQAAKHANLLKQFAGGMAAFMKAMKKSGQWNDVVVMTYSEFGRRAHENGSAGTDHGTAASHFVMGGRVKGGLLGMQPSLDLATQKDMVFTTDFRSIYRTVAEDWLGAQDVPDQLKDQPKLSLIS